MAGEIDSILRGEVQAWTKIAYLLDKVDHTNYWKQHSSSFSDWLKDFALQAKLNENSYWRYLTAGRYYVGLRETLAKRSLVFPPLLELSNLVSPENLELLAKLYRVAPADVFDILAQQVLNNSIRRATLRNAWNAYRPALGGRTSRGLGVAAPLVDLNNIIQRDNVLQARVLTTLISAERSWTGSSSPELYQLFMQISPELKAPVAKVLDFDAVIVVKENPTTACRLHIIDYQSSFSSTLMAHMERLVPFADYIWIALPQELALPDNPPFPDFVGVLQQVGDRIVVLRPARTSANAGSRIDEMLKGLLLRSLKH